MFFSSSLRSAALNNFIEEKAMQLQVFIQHHIAEGVQVTKCVIYFNLVIILSMSNC